MAGNSLSEAHSRISASKSGTCHIDVASMAPASNIAWQAEPSRVYTGAPSPTRRGAMPPASRVPDIGVCRQASARAKRLRGGSRSVPRQRHYRGDRAGMRKHCYAPAPPCHRMPASPSGGGGSGGCVSRAFFGAEVRCQVHAPGPLGLQAVGPPRGGLRVASLAGRGGRLGRAG